MTSLTRSCDHQGYVEPFAGFVLPTSNTTWTMNQFFDVCLPHSSRGCLRVVGALLRWTIGWCDAEGKPQRERHVVSYAEFERAGVGKDSIKVALAEAIDGRFVRCVRSPVMQRAGQSAVSGLYELAWDEGGSDYIKDPSRFRGFFAGEGNRTPIPDQFFDVILPNETLAVIKVVGAVIRFSIGFTTKWGHRRQLASLSYEDIRRYTKIANHSTLSAAIMTAIARNYIRRVEAGYFDPNGGQHSRSAVYALRWLNDAEESSDARKNRPVDLPAKTRSEKRTGNARKNRPAERSEIRTGLQTTEINNILKQQFDAATTKDGGAAILIAQGFDAKTAEALARRYPASKIADQIEWLAYRRVSRNPLGLLRRAIEQDWVSPKVGLTQLSRRNPSNDDRVASDRDDSTAALLSQVAELHKRYRL